MVFNRKNLTKVKLALTVLLSFSLLAACSKTASNPDESIGRQVFQNLNKKGVEQNIIKINSFKKTNGQSYEMLGVKHYKLDYEAEIEYLEDVKGQSMFTPAIITIHKKGEKVEQNNHLTFEQTEKGWKADDGKVY
jgi:hypothetical protein